MKVLFLLYIPTSIQNLSKPYLMACVRLFFPMKSMAAAWGTYVFMLPDEAVLHEWIPFRDYLLIQEKSTMCLPKNSATEKIRIFLIIFYISAVFENFVLEVRFSSRKTTISLRTLHFLNSYRAKTSILNSEELFSFLHLAIFHLQKFQL